MNPKLKQLVEIIQTLFYPLTQNHTSQHTYFVSKECSIKISDKYVCLTSSLFAWNHLEIHTSDGKTSLQQFYSDYDFSDLDHLIIAVMNTYQQRISKEALIEKLKQEQEKIETKIKALENEN